LHPVLASPLLALLRWTGWGRSWRGPRRR
jgi:hypothetical protein